MTRASLHRQLRHRQGRSGRDRSWPRIDAKRQLFLQRDGMISLLAPLASCTFRNSKNSACDCSSLVDAVPNPRAPKMEPFAPAPRPVHPAPRPVRHPRQRAGRCDRPLGGRPLASCQPNDTCSGPSRGRAGPSAQGPRWPTARARGREPPPTPRGRRPSGLPGEVRRDVIEGSSKLWSSLICLAQGVTRPGPSDVQGWWAVAVVRRSPTKSPHPGPSSQAPRSRGGWSSP